MEAFIQFLEKKHFVSAFNDHIYHPLTGKSVDEFTFDVAVTPLTRNEEVIIGVLGYFTMLFLLEKFMKNREAFSGKIFNAIFVVHNLFLTLLSLALFLIIGERVIPFLYRNGLVWSICDVDAFNPHNSLILAYYLNYLTKYYELLDTAFLVLKKKPLQFLHVYHHSLTMVLCYTQLLGHSSVQWVPIFLNLAVHVMMYYYYLVTALGYSVWWKMYVTYAQILQFVLDLIICYFATYIFWASPTDYYSFGYEYCNGTGVASIGGSLLLSSYLYLFIEFFQRTYGRSPAGRASSKPVANNKKTK